MRVHEALDELATGALRRLAPLHGLAIDDASTRADLLARLAARLSEPSYVQDSYIRYLVKHRLAAVGLTVDIGPNGELWLKGTEARTPVPHQLPPRAPAPPRAVPASYLQPACWITIATPCANSTTERQPRWLLISMPAASSP